jgi:hypothetical protein
MHLRLCAKILGISVYTIYRNIFSSCNVKHINFSNSLTTLIVKSLLERAPDFWNKTGTQILPLPRIDGMSSCNTALYVAIIPVARISLYC